MLLHFFLSNDIMTTELYVFGDGLLYFVFMYNLYDVYGHFHVIEDVQSLGKQKLL